MDPLSASEAAWLSEWILRLDACEGYVVLIADPETQEIDVYGPYDGIQASLTADRLRGEFDTDDLADVDVRVVRWHRPISSTAPRGPAGRGS
jgi:hypothetical protein